MRRMAIPLSLAFSIGCAATAPHPSARAPVDRDRATHDVATVLDDWHDAAAHADEARYFGHFARDGVFIGTDASERWDVEAFRAYAHPHFARGRAWAFHAVDRHIVIRDANLAWFDERLATERLGDARGSGVLVRDAGGEWRIAQYVLSLTIPNDRFDAVHRLLEPSSSPPPETAATPSSPAPDGCGEGSLPPRLARYDAITRDVRFSLDLVEDPRGAWNPATPLEMPLHHASSITWNGAEQLAVHHGERVRVVALGMGRLSIEHDRARNTWFATYGARIERVCTAH